MDSEGFVIPVKNAVKLRRMLARRIKGSYTGTDATYEEGIIDTIDWLRGMDTHLRTDYLNIGGTKRRDLKGDPDGQ